MEKTRKWRKILAMMLTVVMMLQNAQSVMVFADVTNEQIEQRLAGNQGQTEETQPAQSQVDTRANGEEYKTQSQETQENGNGSTDIGSPESGNATTEAKTSNADVSATITQSVFQADVSGTTCNFVQMTAQITNNDAENPATGVSVKALLNSAQLSWVNGYGTETAGAGAYAVDSNNTADLPDGSADGYDQIVMWTDQTIGAGETVAYQFAAQIIPASLDGVVNAWYVDGTSCSYTWENTEILVPTQAPVESTPEVAPPQTEPEEKPEVKPEETTPEVTEAPEVTPTPEVTEVPEATPTPEVTEVPEATPTPEVTEVPEATPTPEPTQAVDDDKQAKLDEQNKLLGQSKDRLKIKKAKAPKAQVNDDSNNDTTSANPNGERTTSDDLYTFIYEANVIPDEGTDKGKPIANNGSCEISLKFKEDEQDGGKQFQKVLHYTLPEGITVYRTETGNIEGVNALSGEVLGTYTIEPSTNGGAPTLTITFNDTIKGASFDDYLDLDCSIKFNSWFSKNDIGTGDKEFKFSDKCSVTIDFENGKQFSGRKTVASYIRGNGTTPGYFEFTVEAQSDTDIPEGESFTITDVLESNLELYGNPEISGGTGTVQKTSDGFIATINGKLEANKTVYIKYKAVIKDMNALDAEGNVTNIGNTAYIEKGTDKEVVLPAIPAYKPGNLITKVNNGVNSSDGTVEWIVTINPNGAYDISGKTISDMLPKGLTYYEAEEIQSSPSLTDLTWAQILNQPLKDGWTYTFPANTGYQTYTIRYKTVVPNSDKSQKYTNTVSMDTKQTTSTVTVPGTGSGTGATVKKEFIKEDPDAASGQKYALWKTVITIPDKGAKGVIYSDELKGSHTLEDPLTVTVTDKDNKTVDIKNKLNRIDEKSFQINFGDVDGPQTYTITYRTVVNQNSMLYNTGTLQADGKISSSPVEHQAQDYNFSKTGEVTDADNNIITWTITLNDGSFDLGSETITVTDPLPKGLEYVENTLQLYRNGNSYWDSDTANGAIKSRNPFTVKVGQIPGAARWTLRFETKATGNIDAGTGKTYTNTATIKGSTIKESTVTGSATISKKVFSKTVDISTLNDDSIATYTVLMNEDRLFFAENITYFTFKDEMTPNQKLDRNTIKLERQRTAGGQWTEVPENEISEAVYGDNRIEFKVTTSSDNINRTVYRLTYKTKVSKATKKDEEFKNNAWYTVNGKTEPDSTSEFSPDQSSSSSGQGTLRQYTINKFEIGTKTTLAGAQFSLYKAEDLTPIWENEQVDKNGELCFGLGAELKNKGTYCALLPNVKYVLKETRAPKGYSKAADYYFYIQGTKDKNDAPILQNGSTIAIEDAKEVQVEATKEWEGINDNEIPSITFTLLKKYAGESDSAYKAVSGAETKTVTANNKTVKWENLPEKEWDGNQLKEVIYSIEESINDTSWTADKYSQNITSTKENNIFKITVLNATTSYSVEKKWDDNNNKLQNRPTEIKVQLKQNKQNYGAAVTLTENEGWIYKWDKLPKYDSYGNAYVYTVEESNVNNYTPEYDTTDASKTVITNKLNKDETEFTVKKIWVDGNDADGKRPSSIKVQLYNGDDKYGDEVPLTVNSSGKWEYTWKNLPKVINGKKTSYHAKEVGTVDRYTTSETVTKGNVTTITNTHKYETVDKTVTKIWTGTNETEDNNWKDVEVTLTATATVNGHKTSITVVDDATKILTRDAPTYTWKDLPKYYLGNEITYEVTENTDLSSLGYTSSVDQNTLTITNSYKRITTQRTVKKIWDDNDNQDGVRPAKIKVKITGTAAGKNISIPDDTQELSGKDQINGKTKLEYTWENLPKYAYGTEVEYTIIETLEDGSEISGYTSTSTVSSDGKVITFTNRKDKETTEVSAKKIWDDNSNQDGKRPSVTDLKFQLYKQIADENGQYSSAPVAEGDPVSFTVSSSNSNEWQYTWRNLDKKANGKDIKYTVDEVTTPSEYTKSISEDGKTITNTYTPKTTKITVEKMWSDSNDQDGIRKKISKITLTLKKDVYKNGNYSGTFETVTGITNPIKITDSDEIQTNWTKEWKDLPVYENGSLIKYQVEETIEGDEGKYTSTSDDAYKTAIDASGHEISDVTFKLTNTMVPAKIRITATKAWEDGNNRDHVRNNIKKLSFILYSRKDNETSWTEENRAVFDTDQILNTPNNLTKTWTDLDEYKLDSNNVTQRMHYKVEEEITYINSEGLKYEQPEYSTTDITGEGGSAQTVTITNKHTPETVSVDVTKIWDDTYNTDNYRPKKLEVQLWKTVNEVTEPVNAYPNDANVKTDTISLNQDNNWTGSWSKLYKYEDGNLITYTVKEKEYKNNDKYTNSITGGISQDKNSFSYTLVNKHTPETTDLEVQKIWDDGENEKGLRPDSIEVVLKADGKQFGDAITLSDANNWYTKWEKLPVNTVRGEGDKYHKIIYTVEETTKFPSGNYQVSYEYLTNYENGQKGNAVQPEKSDSWKTCIITNYHETDTTQVTVLKYWNDDNYANRPAVKFQLYRQTYNLETKEYNAEEPYGDAVTLAGTSAQNVWIHTWTKLPRKLSETEEGKKQEKEIKYSVKEVGNLEGYTSFISGEKNIYTVTNVRTTVKISKQDITNSAELPGAELKLYKKDNMDEPVKAWTSGTEPEEFNNLIPGEKYVLVETAAPNGYTIAEKIEFEVSADGKTQTIVMQDKPTEVIVSKKTVSGTEELSGATLQIINSKTNEVVEEWTSGTTEKVISKLPAGNYILHEESAPDTYYKAADIAFKLTEKGEVEIDDKVVDKITMIDYPVKVSISKKALNGKDELPGAELALYKITESEETKEKTETLVTSWTSGEQPQIIGGLSVGSKYVLKEITPPAGYGLAADIEFTVVEDDGVNLTDHMQTVVMTDNKNAVFISKQALGADEELPGAVLQIKDKTGTVIDEWTSEGSVHVVKADLVSGETYILHEEKAPAGYLTAENIEFKVLGNGQITIVNDNTEENSISLLDEAEQTKVITMIDKPRTVSVLKTKEDGTALAGATLRIVDEKNNVVENEWQSGLEAHIVTAKLESGKTYYLEEVQAPAGYTVADKKEFTVNATDEAVVVTMKDEQTKVTISKKAITGEDSIGGAVLQVVDKDGKVVVEKWTTKAGEDTTVTGVFNVGETYTLQEVTPPTGYAKAADINFTLNKKGEIVINDKTETLVVMRDAKLQIKVSKKDITDTDELPGAVLQILDKADNSVIAEWTTTDKPVIITEKDCKKPLVAGNTYILHEKTAPDGYAYAKDVEFTVHVDSIEGNEQLVTMHDAKNVVVVSKTDLAGTKELPGAKLQILSSDGKTVLESWTSTNEEYKVTKKLKAGESYILREIEAPDGYAIADDVKFTVNKDGSTTKVVMKDAQTSVTVSKTDLTGEKEIAGAKLQILNKNGKVMEEWTSDGKTHAVTAALVADVTYTLHEVSAPAGYRTAKDIEFTVDKTGKTTKVVMKDAPTKASILKTDESGKALSGAQLVVKDSTGKEIDKWTSDGKAHEITGLLTVGETYTLSEVSAPSGYTVAPDQTFKMEDKDVIEVTMVDYQASGSGQITVTKKVTYANGGDFIDLIAQDDTFYVNLFTDAAGKYPYKGALPQAIHLVNASAGSVTFSDLAQGTYYVYETDANGNVINLDQQGMHNGSQFMCTVDGGSNIVKLDLKAGPKEGAVNLENVFFDIPTGYSYKGEININKQVLKGTTQTTTDDTFYAGVFTKGDDGVYNLFTVVTLVQNDTVTVEVPLGGKDGTEPINYYILETDADGNILDLDVFEYEVTGEGTVALSKDNLAGNINLVNKIPEDTDGKLRVQKTDGNGVGLAGASFRLTDEDGSVIDEWTSEASAHELELEPGTYTLTEVQAPTGYTGAGSVTIKVDDDYNFSVSGEIDYSYKGGLLKIVNKATTSTPSSGTPVSGGSTPASYSSALSGKVAVKTGDNTPIGAYAAVLVIAALAIAGGIFYKKKRKNDK